MKILYIEDNATAALTIERISTLLKCEVQIAETGAKGLAQLDSDPDIVLVDMQLPDYDGLTLIRKIRTWSSQVPIIVVSGYAMADEKEQCIQLGCTEYLEKPYEIPVMMALLKQYGTPKVGS